MEVTKYDGINRDERGLQQTLNDLLTQERSLKSQIAEIKTGIEFFNSLEYYEEDLQNVQNLINNIRSYIKKDSA